jgi:hypothetical protein
MAMFGINVEEKPWYYALGVGVFIGALLAGAVHWFYFKPLQEEIQNKKTELEGLNQEITKGRAAERAGPVREGEAARNKPQALQILPSSNTEELIRRSDADAGRATSH